MSNVFGGLTDCGGSARSPPSPAMSTTRSAAFPEARLLGVIADTHGLLRPEAVEALEGVDAIVHAGDVDRPGILEPLREIAPVVAVRGNMDRGAWSTALPATEVVEAGPFSIYVLHDLATLDLDPAAAGMDAVVFGHTHRHEARREDGVLYLNPGSAGHRRSGRPATLARLALDGPRPEPELVELAGD